MLNAMLLLPIAPVTAPCRPTCFKWLLLANGYDYKLIQEWTQYDPIVWNLPNCLLCKLKWRLEMFHNYPAFVSPSAAARVGTKETSTTTNAMP